MKNMNISWIRNESCILSANNGDYRVCTEKLHKALFESFMNSENELTFNKHNYEIIPISFIDKETNEKLSLIIRDGKPVALMSKSRLSPQRWIAYDEKAKKYASN